MFLSIIVLVCIHTATCYAFPIGRINVLKRDATQVGYPYPPAPDNYQQAGYPYQESMQAGHLRQEESPHDSYPVLYPYQAAPPAGLPYQGAPQAELPYRAPQAELPYQGPPPVAFPYQQNPSQARNPYEQLQLASNIPDIDNEPESDDYSLFDEDQNGVHTGLQERAARKPILVTTIYVIRPQAAVFKFGERNMREISWLTYNDAQHQIGQNINSETDIRAYGRSNRLQKPNGFPLPKGIYYEREEIPPFIGSSRMLQDQSGRNKILQERIPFVPDHHGMRHPRDVSDVNPNVLSLTGDRYAGPYGLSTTGRRATLSRQQRDIQENLLHFFKRDDGLFPAARSFLENRPEQQLNVSNIIPPIWNIGANSTVEYRNGTDSEQSPLDNKKDDINLSLRLHYVKYKGDKHPHVLINTK